MPTQAEHVAKATALLDEAQKYSRSTPVRLSILVEAQVHATLAQTAQPASTVFNITAPAAEDAPKAAKPAARRTRKASGEEAAK